MSSKIFVRLIVVGVALLSLFLYWRNAQRQRLSEALLQAVTNCRVADMKSLLLRGADVHLPVMRSGTSDLKDTPFSKTFDNLPLLCEATTRCIMPAKADMP